MAQLSIDLSGVSGLAPRYYGDRQLTASSPNLRYLGQSGQVAEGIYNPITRLGYMSPANDTVKAVTGTTNFLLTSVLVTSRAVSFSVSPTDAIFFGDEAVTGTTGKVMNLDTAVDTSLDQIYEYATSGGNYSKVEDMITYMKNGSVQNYIIRRDTTDGTTINSISVTDYQFSSVTPAWSDSTPVGASTTLLNGGCRSVFVLSDNGFLYVLNGNQVHKIDGGVTGGTNGTITAAVLMFIGSTTNPTTMLIDGVDFGGRMWIGMHTTINYDADASTDIESVAIPNNVGVYIWDRRTTVFNMQNYIPIKGVRRIKSMHVFQGKASCFTVSTDGYTEFRVWNGNEFKVVKTLGKNAFPAYRRHSVYEAGDYIMWLGNDGKIYGYGIFEPGLDNALHILGDMSLHVTGGQTYSGSGVFAAINNTETVTSGTSPAALAFYLSFKDTGGNHLVKWYPYGTQTIASNTQVSHPGDVYTLVQNLPGLSNIKDITFNCIPMGSSGSTTVVATIAFYANQSTVAFKTASITEGDVSRGYVQLPLNKSYVNSLQFKITWTAQTMGIKDFCPSYAVLGYEPTKTTMGPKP